MRRAAAKRTRIAVESRSRTERWQSAGRRLLQLDVSHFDRILAVAELAAAKYDDDVSWSARLAVVESDEPGSVN